MGYTHYWNTKPELDKTQWAAFIDDVCKIYDVAKAHKIELQYEFDEPKPPIVDLNVVRFNGVGKDGHETFLLDRKGRPSSSRPTECFGFCKTAQKPYDTAVTAVLIVAKHHFKDDIAVTSDGQDEDWEEGRQLCAKILGYGDEYHMDNSSGEEQLTRR